METSHTPPSKQPHKWSASIQESISIKLITIAILVLMLLIPTEWVKDLITERQDRAQDAINEVSSSWAGRQSITGPVLIIPYTYSQSLPNGEGTESYTDKVFFLPENFSVKGDVLPDVRHRGLFDVVIYKTDLTLTARFNMPDFKALGIQPENVHWQDAKIAMAISDARGIQTLPNLSIGQQQLTTAFTDDLGFSIQGYLPSETQTSKGSTRIPKEAPLTSQGLIAALPWQSADDFISDLTLMISMRGSQQLNFIPAAQSTTVHLKSPWSSPSFSGTYLPDEDEVTDTGFTAQWKVLHLTQNFATQWIGNGHAITGDEFGVRLLMPVDQYQKSMRTSKYAILIIVLTFVSLFLVEIIRKVRIHPFQYILIGAALIVYYTLLLSISEQLGFNTAYWIATGATITLISLYASSFLPNAGLIVLFTSLISVFYAFIFVIILQQDLSLLLGSIGLFLVIAAIMYFSRKVKWYHDQVTA